MERRVENYFPYILKITGDVFKESIQGKGIPSEYKGYISTFGAMVLQNGVLPALAFFEKNDSNSNQKRDKIPEIMKRYLIENDPMFKGSSINKKLVEIVVEKIKLDNNSFDREKLRIIEGKLLDLSIALKLALRTYISVTEEEK